MLRFDVLSYELQAVLLLELLYTAASVSKLLLACKEWVAFWADVADATVSLSFSIFNAFDYKFIINVQIKWHIYVLTYNEL